MGVVEAEVHFARELGFCSTGLEHLALRKAQILRDALLTLTCFRSLVVNADVNTVHREGVSGCVLGLRSTGSAFSKMQLLQ